MDRSHLQIKAYIAKTFHLALTNVVATVLDLLWHDDMLNIDGKGVGLLNDFLTFTKNSPVDHWIGNLTKDEGKGSAKLQLALHIPLLHAGDSKVNDVLQFLNNDMILQKIIPPLQSVSGKLEFNQKGFNLEGIIGHLLGGPVQVSGGTQSNSQSNIKIDGSATLGSIRAAYLISNAHSILKHARGSIRYNATLTIRDNQTKLLINSSLRGIALNFLTPLREAANEILPLKFEWVGVLSDDPLLLRNEIRMSLGTVLTAGSQRQKSIEKSAE
ncbi:MAG: hypothetical protein H7240_05470 [Glaciimonas sp.]|nr:hypothetical protein [Glaciimonas sp.]